jgi:CRP/FNR family cyclic AMP-dependent transcriptional regulator
VSDLPGSAAVPADSDLAILTYRRGQHVFREGEDGASAYIIERGAVDIWREGPDGDRIVFATLGPGGVFGELALIHPAPRNANATATDVTTLIVVPKFVLEKQMKKTDPFIRKMMLALIGNVRRLSDRIDELEGGA